VGRPPRLTPLHNPGVAAPPLPERSAVPAATLDPDAVGFLDTLVIGLASTSPAYSLAAVLGPIVALVGVHAPGVLLLSFVPMLLIAGAFAALNRVDPDCGTTFSWVSRALGPWAGWIGGWAITMTGVLVLGSLAEVGVRFTLLAVGLDGWTGSTPVVTGLTVALILLMAWICVRGTEVSARLQNGLILAQTAALAVFAVVALARGSVVPSWNWLDPFGSGGAALNAGLLLGVFAYWGWESAVNLTEETTNSRTAPGWAAVLSTVLLLLTYLGVATAVLAFAGTGWLAGNADEEEAVFALLSTRTLGGWDWVVLLAVATSAIASTQTTIIPASRTALSMARRAALPRRFASISRTHRTPEVSTWWVAAVGIAWYVGVGLVSENALYDSITGLSLLIALYYALTGLACAVFFRHRLLHSLRDFLLLGVGPLAGAAMLAWLLVLSVRDLADAGNSYTGQAWLGVGPPLVIGVGVLAAGVVLMLWWRRRDATFWRVSAGDRRP
jgi:amino acid transporter